MAFYVGDNGVNQLIRELYLGDNGVNHRIREAWAGDNGVNQKFWDGAAMDVVYHSISPAASETGFNAAGYARIDWPLASASVVGWIKLNRLFDLRAASQLSFDAWVNVGHAGSSTRPAASVQAYVNGVQLASGVASHPGASTAGARFYPGTGYALQPAQKTHGAAVELRYAGGPTTAADIRTAYFKQFLIDGALAMGAA